ncbi:unnamed protein product [Coccothraustes coccothraustes]
MPRSSCRRKEQLPHGPTLLPQERTGRPCRRCRCPHDVPSPASFLRCSRRGKNNTCAALPIPRGAAPALLLRGKKIKQLKEASKESFLFLYPESFDMGRHLSAASSALGTPGSGRTAILPAGGGGGAQPLVGRVTIVPPVIRTQRRQLTRPEAVTQPEIKESDTFSS